MPSTTTSADLSTNTIRVKLIKDKHVGLGFLVKQRKLKPFVLVANIVAGGVAEESGLVQVGDIILRINDIDLTDMSYGSAVEVLKAVPLDTPVVMLLRGPEGYTTYLQTSFQENGLPKTIRVTKPIQETLMGRLKKTFTGSSGPMSPVKSIKKFCNGETEKMDKFRDKDTASSDRGGGGDKPSQGNCLVSVEELDELSRSKICTHVGNGGVVGVNIAGQKTGEDGNVMSNDSISHKSESCGLMTDKSKFMFSRESRVDSQEETVLDNGAIGSPKIVLTSPKSNNKDGQVVLPRSEAGKQNNTEDGQDHSQHQQQHQHRKAIEIVQDDDKIMVVVRGDISVRSEDYTDSNNCTTASSTIIVSRNSNNHNNNNNNKSNGSDDYTSGENLQKKQDGSDNRTSSTTNGSNAKRENGSDAHAAKTHSSTNGKSNGQAETTGNGGRTSRRNSGRASPRRGRSPVTSPTCMWRAGDASDDEGGTPRGRRLEKKRTSSPTLGRRRSTDRRGSINTMASPKRFAKLKNVMDERRTTIDTLHPKSIVNVPCSQERCMGSMMNAAVARGFGVLRPHDELILHAKDFCDQYFTSIKRNNTPSHQKRWAEIQESIDRSGTYDLTTPELTYGAKLAWRNAPRCIGRIQWSKLQVFDARHILTARGMYEAICNHIKYGTNKGNLRSAITIFPQRKEGRGDFRVWNVQLVRYAGYKMEDGTTLGDPSNVEFTDLCIKLGWKPLYGMFDVLPLVLSAAGSDPEWFEIPPELVLEVNIKHPKYPWFADLGLKWYGLPAVSCMLFDCGGLEFTACPFNGWYMGTEIGARDFCDSGRYNILPLVANKMGLDVRKAASLWKDRALVEVNIAVLHSFQSQTVTITDHHSASESFMKHLENEQKLRGGCPADWVWVVPPMSGSIMEVFHQEMLMYNLKPSYEYQEDAWKTHVWRKDKNKSTTGEKPKRKFGFKELARAVKFSAKLMGKALARRVKCTILFATETGKSERFAQTLCEIFKHAFDAKVMSMEDYDVLSLEHESLVLIVTSTFGNGDPPENGEAFSKCLYDMKKSSQGDMGDEKSGSNSHSRYVRMSNKNKDKKGGEEDPGDLNVITGPMGNVRYSVFALGSKAYPHFAAFGHYLDNVLTDLGAEKICQVGEGDELCGQEESFRKWAEEVFKSACDTFCLGDDVNISEATGALNNSDHNWTPTRFRVVPYAGGKEPDLCEAISKVHGKTILPCLVKERIQLQSEESDRQTILVKLDTQGDTQLFYNPGDHVGVYPANNPEIVNGIMSRLYNAPTDLDMVVKTEYLHEVSTPLGTTKTWTQFEKMPVCSLRLAFTHILDITTPPSQALLSLLATQAHRDIDKERLELLATDSNEYEDWKYDLSPNILEVMDQFQSLKVPPSLLLTQLPLLQQRYYSISSSPQVCPGDIHATIAVVKFRTQNGAGPVHEGVCSSWLNRCDESQVVPCMVRTAPLFHLPANSELPIIMVGPGTGIAPFRSFWQQRSVDMQMYTDKKFGNMTMYFGCRYSVQDNIYKAELEEMKQAGVLSDYRVALSREADMPKVYVQDILLNNAREVYTQLSKQGGHFYVCGDVSMAHDVTRTLEKIVQECGKMSEDDAAKFVNDLRDDHRFHEDIFGVGVRRAGERQERSKDQSARALEYLNALSKPDRNEKAVMIGATAQKDKKLSKPRVPIRNIFKHKVAPDTSPTDKI